MMIDTIAIGPITVLRGADGGKYPDGNCVLVRGSSERVLVDASLSLAHAAEPPRNIDRLLITHAHEDHLSGVWRYPGVPIHAHTADVEGVRSLDGLMAVYGLPPATEARWRVEVVEKFGYVPRPDAIAFADGDVFDAGGVRLRAVHLPGHTSGHCGFYVEPHGIMLLADIDLTGFGPYYGDASSDLDSFERSIARCREIDAHTYVTFHHKGIIEGRAAFLSALDEYTAVIGRRERALLEYLSAPRTLDEIVAHRFIYRPHVTLLFVEGVERRSAQLHLARLLADGRIVEVAPGLFERR